MCLYSCGEVRLGYAKKHYIWGGEMICISVQNGYIQVRYIRKVAYIHSMATTLKN